MGSGDFAVIYDSSVFVTLETSTGVKRLINLLLFSRSFFSPSFKQKKRKRGNPLIFCLKS